MNQLSKFASFRSLVQGAGAVCTVFQVGRKWKAQALLAAIVVLNLAAVYMLVLINGWNRLFYLMPCRTRTSPCSGSSSWGDSPTLAFAYTSSSRSTEFYLTQLLEGALARLDDENTTCSAGWRVTRSIRWAGALFRQPRQHPTTRPAHPGRPEPLHPATPSA